MTIFLHFDTFNTDRSRCSINFAISCRYLLIFKTGSFHWTNQRKISLLCSIRSLIRRFFSVKRFAVKMLYLSNFDSGYVLRSRQPTKCSKILRTEVKMLRAACSYLRDDVNLFFFERIIRIEPLH